VHPRSPVRSLLVLVVLGLVAVFATACSISSRTVSQASGGPTSAQASPPFIPQIISSETIVGANRLLFGILDPSGTQTIASPDLKMKVAFAPADGSSGSGGSSAPPPVASPVLSTAATFIWAIPNERGVYVADVTFPAAGVWTAAFGTDGATLTLPGAASSPATGSPAASPLTIPAATVTVSFDVKEIGAAIPIGGKAPSTRTPIAATPADVARIATDPNPDPSFYTTSVDEALAKHEPFVLVFATPAFCTSRQCGPTLDGIKAVSKTETGVVFINVEPYKLEYVDGHLQPVLDANNQLQATDTTQAWGLLSEPWVFVVDKTGIVRASFEAVVSPDELKAAIAAVR
jgi:hypothetical protein